MALSEILPASAFQIDIEALVSATMAVERQPLGGLQTAQNGLSLKSATLTDLKSSLSALRSKATALVQAGSLSPFHAKAVALSQTGIATVVATPSAFTGVHTLSVSQLAKLSSVVSKQISASGTDVWATEGAGVKTVKVAYDGSDPATSGTAVSVNVTVSDGDSNSAILTKLVEAINNDATLGEKVNASVVNDTATTARLVLASKQTGLANKVRVADAPSGGTLLATIQLDSEIASSGTGGGFLYADSALDAKFKLDGLDIARSGNSVSDVLTGVTISLLGLSTSDATLTVSADKTSIKASVQAFLGAYNSAIKFLRDRIGVKVSATTTAGGLTQVDSVARGSLAGETSYLSLFSSLRSDLSKPVSTVQTGNPVVLAGVGITAASDGSLSISDPTKFDRAADANPTGIMDLFASSDGVAQRLITRLDRFVKTGGVVDGSLSTVKSKVENVNRQITTLQERLSMREVSLRNQLLGLQEALSALSAQRLFFQ